MGELTPIILHDIYNDPVLVVVTSAEQGKDFTFVNYAGEDNFIKVKETVIEIHELIEKTKLSGLRDRIAMEAIKPMIAGGGYMKWADMAHDAYGLADAMLSARSNVPD